MISWIKKEHKMQNIESSNNGPKCYYVVSEYLSTFDKSTGQNIPFSNQRRFEENDLTKCKTDALNFYHQRCRGIENEGSYSLPLEKPENIKLGINAAYAISVKLVVEYDAINDFQHYVIIGEDESDQSFESKNIEMEVFNDNELVN